MQVGKKRVAKQVGRQVDSQVGRQVGRYMQVGKEVDRESLGQTVGRQVRRESLGRYVGRQVERGVPSCVRSTLQDYRTKTTRYTLFSLNWRKRSSAKLSAEIRSQLRLRQICKTKHNQDFITFKYQLLLVGNFLSSFAIYYLYSGTYYYTIASNSVIQPYMYNVLLQ